MDIREQIKNRINVDDLIREYIEIKKAGANYKALCPFHSEKSPSFMISPDKGIWHCFGCEQGGDIFGFVMRIEGVDFPEALNLLAKKAGVEVTRQNPELVSQKTKLMDILEEATNFYHQELAKNKEAKEYLDKRGLKNETIALFKIGFAPNGWTALVDFLKSKSFVEREIVLAGLAMRKEDRNSFYDRFRGRIMFPIFNHYGNVLGFTARVLPQYDDGKSGKYINTPETLTYKKSTILYGLNFAKQEIRRQDVAVVVEGNMDVIALHQAGFKNVIATSGTALTREQTLLLARYSKNIIMSFDADSAGFQAVLRGIDVALASGLNVKVLQMPKDNDGALIAKDPDELIKKDPNLWPQAQRTSKQIIDFYIDSYLPKFNFSDPHQNAKFANIILTQIKKIKNSLERSLWIKKLSIVTGASENILLETIKNLRAVEEFDKPEAPILVDKLKTDEKELRFLSCLLNEFEIAKQFLDELPADAIKTMWLRDIYTHIILYYNDRADGSLKEFKEWLDSLGKDSLDLEKILLYKDKEFADSVDVDMIKELQKKILFLKSTFLKENRNLFMQEMVNAERLDDKEQIAQILKKFKDLN